MMTGTRVVPTGLAEAPRVKPSHLVLRLGRGVVKPFADDPIRVLAGSVSYVDLQRCSARLIFWR